MNNNNRPQQLVLDANKYFSRDEFWKTVSGIMDVLTNNEYEIAFRYEGEGIYVIEYNYSRFSELCDYDTPIVRWLTEEQMDQLPGYFDESPLSLSDQIAVAQNLRNDGELG